MEYPTIRLANRSKVRVAVHLALGAGAVLGDVGDPDPVRGVGGEDPPDVVLEHRRAGLARLMGQEPVPQPRVLRMRVMQRVDAVRLNPHRVGHGPIAPPVVGLAGEFQDPVRGP